MRGVVFLKIFRDFVVFLQFAVIFTIQKIQAIAKIFIFTRGGGDQVAMPRIAQTFAQAKSRGPGYE